MKRIMRAFKLNEISAVDRPAQEGARMVIMKRDFDAAQRRSAASSGAAMPDGSFPIENKEDLANARRLVGHAKDKAAAEAHIRRRAKALGVDLDKMEVLTMDITQEDLSKMIADATNAAVEKALMDAATKAAEDAAFLAAKAAESETDEGGKKKTVKMEDLPEDMRKAFHEAKANEVLVKQLMDDREIAIYAKRAVSLGFEEQDGEMLRKAYSGEKEAITKLESMLKGLREQVSTGKLFAEFGTKQGAPATAAAEMDGKVLEMVDNYSKAGKSITKEQAFVKVYEDARNSDLKKRFDTEDFRKRQQAAGTV